MIRIDGLITKLANEIKAGPDSKGRFQGIWGNIEPCYDNNELCVCIVVRKKGNSKPHYLYLLNIREDSVLATYHLYSSSFRPYITGASASCVGLGNHYLDEVYVHKSSKKGYYFSPCRFPSKE